MTYPYRLFLAAVAALLMSGTALAQAPKDGAVATFAGGCFWCVEEAFDHVPGVLSTTSGFSGGKEKHPSYNQVAGGNTGHAESVQVVYDPQQVSYETLLEVFWHNIDPTVDNRQFCDGGYQYRATIFVHTDEQRRLAEASKAALMDNKPFREKILTPIVDYTAFYPAEEYHQDFHIKNPIRYHTYKFGCGRARRLKQLWGDEAGGPFHG